MFGLIIDCEYCSVKITIETDVWTDIQLREGVEICRQNTVANICWVEMD